MPVDRSRPFSLTVLQAKIYPMPIHQCPVPPLATNEQKMPLPQASTVVVTVTHPCYVSVLKTKLHRILGIPLADVRYVLTKDKLMWRP